MMHGQKNIKFQNYIIGYYFWNISIHLFKKIYIFYPLSKCKFVNIKSVWCVKRLIPGFRLRGQGSPQVQIRHILFCLTNIVYRFPPARLSYWHSRSPHARGGKSGRNDERYLSDKIKTFTYAGFVADKFAQRYVFLSPTSQFLFPPV